MNKLDYKSAVDYWSSRKDGENGYAVYKQNDAGVRSAFLVNLVNSLKLPLNARICEPGCNVCRNLYYLEKAGYTNLIGFDVNKHALENAYSVQANLTESSISLYFNYRVKYDLIFTMAVLEHIPYDMEYVFQNIADSTKYLITIEDERSNHTKRHFPRNYKTVFENLGMRQIGSIHPNLPGCNSGFIARIHVAGS